MKKSWLLALVIGAGAVLWLASGLLSSGEKSADSVANGLATSPTGLPSVRGAVFDAQAMTQTLIVSGRTLAQRSVPLRAEIGGRVEAVAFRQGDRVEAGQLLVQLAAEDRPARVTEARAMVTRSEAELSAAQQLSQRGLASDTELSAARAAVDSARANLVLAELNVERLEIRAPFAGILDEREVEIGEILDRGAPIATLVELHPLRVRANVSETYLGRVRVGMSGIVTFVGGVQVEGVVTFVGARADEFTRTFPIELEVPNPDSSLIAQVSAQVRVPLQERQAHLLPASLLGLSDDGVLGVKAVDENDTVVFRPVSIVGDGDGGLWVEGLGESVWLITVGHEFVLPGQRVRRVEAAGQAERP